MQRILSRRTPAHIYLPAQEYTPSSFYSTLRNGSSDHSRFGKKIFQSSTNAQVFNYTGWDHFVLCTLLPIHTSQPKYYEVVLYTDDVQLLYPIDSF